MLLTTSYWSLSIYQSETYSWSGFEDEKQMQIKNYFASKITKQPLLDLNFPYQYTFKILGKS